MPKSRKSSVSWGEIGSATIGAAVGGVLGMLFAPQSGRKSRSVAIKEGKKLATSAERVFRKAVRTAVTLEKNAAKSATKTSTRASSSRKTTKKVTPKPKKK